VLLNQAPELSTLTFTAPDQRRFDHPLEPLTEREVQQSVELLRSMADWTPNTRIISITLKEPSKSAVYAWPSAPVSERLASAVIMHNARNRAATVTLDLEADRVVSVQLAPEGAQPTLSVDEQIECEQAVLASEEFRHALERHYGPVDPALVMVDIWSAGHYGDDDQDSGKRLTRPLCFLRSDPTDNGYARPIEGIRPIVDLNSMKVVRVEDYGKWPLPPESANYSANRVGKLRDDIKPLAITQSDGPSFRLEGHQISWQKWKFVIGFNAREGLTIHHVRYVDSGQERSILYRASLTEMVVPYGDPRPTQARKNAFDVGEYGMGMCANGLQLGCDCLGDITYLDANLCDSRGRALTIPNAICIHEEDYGILWKHTDRRLPDHPEVRRSRRLVVSSISTVENYEYGFYWYFYQDGNIEFQIKLTGILSLGATHPDERPPHGAMVAPQVYAPNHQHFFNMRLDFDIDGQRNTIHQVDVVADPVDEQNPFGNAFRTRPTVLRSEKQACANLNPATARTWRIINPGRKNRLGEPVGYKFIPGDNAVPFASPEAWWRKRARFVDHHVWVTPFHESENFAAGDFPNQSLADHGLSTWVEADRPIEDTDTVLWYTFGHTHIPRPEDYPVMPAAYIGFLLKPSGFFECNPGVDVPPSAAAKHASNGTCGHC
jgi:primary-amine oxidase